MPVVTFTVKTKIAVVRLDYRKKGSGSFEGINLVDQDGVWVGTREFPAGSELVASLFLHYGQKQTADFTIEQEDVGGKIMLAERLGIYVEKDLRLEVEFGVRDPDCP